MELLRHVRHRGGLVGTRARRGPIFVVPAARLAAAALIVLVSACRVPDSEPGPDDVLRRQLGLGDGDRVRTVRISGGPAERAEPALLDSVTVGTWVQFVTDDWFVHEVAFERDSLGTDARAFLERTDQLASPPLLHQDARFVVSFADAPEGRYPYLLEGNGSPGRGVIVVVQQAVR